MKRVLVCIFAMLLVISACVLPVSAQKYDHTINNDGSHIPTPLMYQVQSRIRYLGEEYTFFNAPTDLFMDDDGYLYVCDTGNNRVLKMTTEGEVSACYTEAEGLAFSSPQGVYVSDDGLVYISDTNNNRIVKLNADGSFIKAYDKPNSELLEDEYTFNPTKLYINEAGSIYTLRYQNLLLIDENNEFQGYVGSAKVGFSLKNMFIRMFASDSQRKQLSIALPPPVNNFVIDDKGMIYVASQDAGGRIKILNSVGNNIYAGGTYGETVISGLTKNEPMLMDIAVDSQGIITVVQENNATLYQYDMNGNLLGYFGGYGTDQDQFLDPISLTVDPAGRLYVLDKEQKCITVLAPTEYTSLIHQATVAYEDGDYEGALAAWYRVQEMNENYDLSYSGIADYYMKQDAFKEAMELYRLGNDKDGYSKAFAENRHEFIRSNFGWIILAALVLVVGVCLLYVWLSRTANRHTRLLLHLDRGDDRPTEWKLFLAMLFHPLDAYSIIRMNRSRLKFRFGIVFVVAAIVSRLVYILIAEYSLNDVNVRTANPWLEAGKILLLVITFAVANFAITSIMSGESKFSEIFTVTCISLTPYILFTIPLGLLSRVMCGEELGLYRAIEFIILIWVVMLMLISIYQMNSFTFRKTILVVFLCAFTMILIWTIIVLVFFLTKQLWEFLSGFWKELSYQFWS